MTPSRRATHGSPAKLGATTPPASKVAGPQREAFERLSAGAGYDQLVRSLELAAEAFMQRTGSASQDQPEAIAHDIADAVVWALDPSAPDHYPRPQEVGSTLDQLADVVARLGTLAGEIGTMRDDLGEPVSTPAGLLPVPALLNELLRLTGSPQELADTLRERAAWWRGRASRGGPRISRRRLEFAWRVADIVRLHLRKEPTVGHATLNDRPDAVHTTRGGPFVEFVAAVVKAGNLARVFGWSARQLADDACKPRPIG